jgi:hypothetical protein
LTVVHHCVLFLVGVNLGSRAHYIGFGGGAYCPLIEGVAPDQGMGCRLGPLVAKPIEDQLQQCRWGNQRALTPSHASIVFQRLSATWRPSSRSLLGRLRWPF